MASESPVGNGLSDWLSLLENRHTSQVDLGLDRCGTVYERLGSPRPARRIITVAGTNGKGSTVAWMCAALDALGLSHGAYTSPHLLRFNERLRLQHREVDTDTQLAAFETVEAAREDTSLTYFEFTTLACLHIMAASDLDVAVLEVGLGGRLDTVNLVDTDLAVITPIGLDHQAFLGEDRLTIGREKAGILRTGKPLVAGEAQPPVSVLERATELGCPVLVPTRDFDLEPIAEGRLGFRLGERTLEFAEPPLAQAHQRQNLATALAAVLTLEAPGPGFGKRLGPALASTRMPGRLQRMGANPGFLVDVGHNPLAAAVVQAALDAEGLSGPCVLGMLADKDAESVARLLAPSVTAFYCAGLEDDWRGQTGNTLAERVASAVEERSVTPFPTVRSAMAAARAAAGPGESVLVFGSFHTAAQALGWLQQKGFDQPA
jgi:dihydrofolate synthase/folylpolyglutamate synthase